jgi:hypothetical protein
MTTPEQRITDTLAVHTRETKDPKYGFYGYKTTCSYCESLNYSHEGLDDRPGEYVWPCTTVQALTGEKQTRKSFICMNGKIELPLFWKDEENK